MVVVADTTAIEGPHQLRVGLRRLRTAFALFEPWIGGEAMAALGDTARDLGQEVGALRDADVLLDEVVAEAAAEGLDEPAPRRPRRRPRRPPRRRPRPASAPRSPAPAATGFLFDLAAFIEARGWLAPPTTTSPPASRTGSPTAAPAILRKRHRRVMKTGRRIRELDPRASTACASS